MKSRSEKNRGRPDSVFLLGWLFFFGVLRGGILCCGVLGGSLLRRFLGAGVFRGRAVATGLFAGVIRDIPARAFELDRRSGLQAFNFSAAVRTLFQVRSGDAFNFFRALVALGALILVQRHSAPS